MGNFIVKDPPEYSDEMRTLETTDPDHADVFNELFGQLINNDAFLKKLADEIKPNMASLRKSVTLSGSGTWNILDLPGGCGGILTIYRFFNNTAPQCTTIMFNTHFYGTGSGRRAIITQLEDLSEQFANIAFRITHDGAIEHLEMIYNSNTINELNITAGVLAFQRNLEPVINFHKITEEYETIYRMEVYPNSPGYPRKRTEHNNMIKWDCLDLTGRGTSAAPHQIYLPTNVGNLYISHSFIEILNESHAGYGFFDLFFNNSRINIITSVARESSFYANFRCGWFYGELDMSKIGVISLDGLVGGWSGGNPTIKNAVVLGACKLHASLVLSNCECNLQVVKGPHVVTISNCTGRVIDENGNNLIS